VSTTSPPGSAARYDVPPSEGTHYGWLLFAGIILVIAGVLNVIYGIGGISKSHFYTQNAHYVFSDLKTWGWITMLVGVLQLLAGLSLWRGGLYGRIFGIGAASLAALAALLSIAGAPFLSLSIFALSILVIYGLASYGTE